MRETTIPAPSASLAYLIRTPPSSETQTLLPQTLLRPRAPVPGLTGLGIQGAGTLGRTFWSASGAQPCQVTSRLPQVTSSVKASAVHEYKFKGIDQLSQDRTTMEYELAMRQQPKQARMCGSGDKADRRPIDPPPIVRLRIRDRSKPIGEDEPQNLIQSPFYFMFASLVTADSDDELFCVANTKSRYLTGSIVSSLYHLRDPSDNTYSAFFVFPDIGVRVEGQFRFRLTMYEIAGNEVHQCASIYSNPFTVYSAKRFPGMEGSTELSKSFAEQGIRIRIRRPIRLRRRAATEGTGDGDEDDASPQPPNKRSKTNSSGYEQASAAQYAHPMYGSTGGYTQQTQPHPAFWSSQIPSISQRPAYPVGHVPVPSYPSQGGSPQTYSPATPSSPRQGGQIAYGYSYPASITSPQQQQYGFSAASRQYPYTTAQQGAGVPAFAAAQTGFPNAHYASNGHSAYAPAGYPMQSAGQPQAYYGMHPQGYSASPGTAVGNGYSGQDGGSAQLPPLKDPALTGGDSAGANDPNDAEGPRGTGSLASLLN